MGFVLGGILRGVGQHMVENARAQREAALEELRQMRADQRADRQFERQADLTRETNKAQYFAQREENEADRRFKVDDREDRQTFDSGIRQDDRTFQSQQASLQRSFQRAERLGEQEYQIRRDRILSSLEQSEGRAAAQREMREISDIRIGENGEIVGLRRDGTYHVYEGAPPVARDTGRNPGRTRNGVTGQSRANFVPNPRINDLARSMERTTPGWDRLSAEERRERIRREAELLQIPLSIPE